MRPSPLRILVAVTTAAVVAGCSSSGSSGHGGPGGDATRDRLVKQAHLDPCPHSSTTPVDGGLPDVTLSCLGNGPDVHLAGLTGAPTVVNIWGSWCIPCQKEAGILSTVYDALHRKVRFLGVDTEDSDDSALDFGTHVSPPVRYPSVVDPDRKVLLGLAKAAGPPQTAFVNPAGVVVHVSLGPYDDAAALRADIAKYLHVK
ncbi:MAG TPA: TlpA disulfide reductase family protein [Mycobacteriales bacterium]|nr:TlpA disulfide reductase family protein [Mycobacteriales bacterium]